MEEARIKTQQIVDKITDIEEIVEIRPNLVELPMIDDVCKYMYHRVGKGEPISTIFNGVRIVMFMND